ncbi:MAG: hypothetical protein AAFR87_04140 [Bacteroidota bacterium]
MKKISIHIGLVLLLFGLLFTAFRFEESPMGALEEYVEKIEGIWVNEHRDTDMGEPDVMWIEIKREWIYRNQVRIKISEYCKPGFAEYLLFELVENNLIYVGAMDKDENFCLLYLDYAEISYEVEEGQTVLYYESCEAEMQNHLHRKLIRINESTFNTSSIL